jgi:hypothetical protein
MQARSAWGPRTLALVLLMLAPVALVGSCLMAKLYGY